MAEVVNIPKVETSSLTREHSSLNSEPAKEKPAIQKVELKNAVTVKKPSFFKKLRDTFVKEDIADVGDYILWDIVVPTIGRTINDIICGSSNRIFLGSGAPQSSGYLYREKGVTYVRPQTNYSTASTRKASQKAAEAVRPATRNNFHLDEIIFADYNDAAAVLDRMVDYLETYGQVSVDDYFDLIGRSTTNYVSQDWGWKSLANATIVNTVGGYFIKLPAPVMIKR